MKNKSKTILVNFADDNFKKKQKVNSISGKILGGVDAVLEFTPNDIEEDVYKLNSKNTTHSKKGFGNYFWKPVIIEKALKKINVGDYLFYADSGSTFLKSIRPLVTHLEKKQKPIMCFSLPLIEKQWTKKDAFVLMDCNSEYYSESCQRLATFLLIKKSKESLNFVKKWKYYAADYRILSDAPNELGQPNDEHFVEHRHDQSILSLLSKKNEDLVLVENDLSDFGCFPYRYTQLNKNYLYDKSKIKNVAKNRFRGTLLCNRSNHPLIYFLKYVLRSILYRFGIEK